MEFSLDLGYEEESLEVQEDYGEIYEIVSEATLIPKVGLFLGLDIAEGSSGVCLYENGVKTVANIALITSEKEDFREVKLRRELKSCLRELVLGRTFDLIIIEDAFQGVNPTVTRLLYALNTAIDELIVDGECCCKKFLRVSNKTWKSWLFTIDMKGLYRGLTDKLRIQKCLELLGVYDEGEGFQDRLDATGLLLGYFLCKNSADKKLEEKKLKRVTFGDIEYGYQEDIDFILPDVFKTRKSFEKLLVFEKRWSKQKMLDYLTKNPNYVCVTDDYVKLGSLASDLDLPYLDDGGFFAFWIKGDKLKKYQQE